MELYAEKTAANSFIIFIYVLYLGIDYQHKKLCLPLTIYKTDLQPGFEDENAMDTPVVRYCAVSSIEHSHRSAVTDLQWVPDHMEVRNTRRN